MEDSQDTVNKPKKTVIIAGASGLTGSALLRQLSQDKSFERIILLSRKPLNSALPKVKEEIVDFSDLGRYSFWEEANAVFCCIGTTIKTAGSQENFRKVDYEIPVALGEQCAKYGIGMFLISSVGANAQSGNFYLRTKGETEQALAEKNLPYLYIYRPSMLLGNRKEARFGESLGKILMAPINPLLMGSLKKYRGVHVDKVATTIMEHAKNPEMGVHFVESDEINR